MDPQITISVTFYHGTLYGNSLAADINKNCIPLFYGGIVANMENKFKIEISRDTEHLWLTTPKESVVYEVLDALGLLSKGAANEL